MGQARGGPRWAAVSLALVALAACGAPDGRRFETTLRQPDGSYALRVVLGDQTGLVTGIEPGGVGQGPFDLVPAVSATADKSTLEVSWLGGACAKGVQLSFAPLAGGLSLRLRGEHGLFESCTLIGLFRTVYVRVSEPVDAAAITTSGQE